MYRVRTAGHRKRDPAMRWALPDRVFFACGACHVLADAWLERFGADAAQALALVPAAVEALTSEAKSREIPGLWLRKPGQFLHDAMPRARAYLDRFAHPPSPIRLRRGRRLTRLNPCDAIDTKGP